MIALALLLVAIIAHEIGHLLAARAFGWPGRLGIAWVRWLPFPVARVVQPARTNTWSLVAVAAAGPLASVLVGVAFLPLSALAGWVSILLGVLSLAPIPRWDGAHIWRAVRS